MSCPQCVGIEQSFDNAEADAELGRFRRKGPATTTRLLIEGLKEGGCGGSHAAGHRRRRRRRSPRPPCGGGGQRGRRRCVIRVPARGAHGGRQPRRGAPRHASLRELRGDGRGDLPRGHRHPRQGRSAATTTWRPFSALRRAMRRRPSAWSSPAIRGGRRFMNRLLNLVQRLKGTPFRTFVHPYARITEILRSCGLESIVSTPDLLLAGRGLPPRASRGRRRGARRPAPPATAPRRTAGCLAQQPAPEEHDRHAQRRDRDELHQRPEGQGKKYHLDPDDQHGVPEVRGILVGGEHLPERTLGVCRLAEQHQQADAHSETDQLLPDQVCNRKALLPRASPDAGSASRHTWR